MGCRAHSQENCSFKEEKESSRRERGKEKESVLSSAFHARFECNRSSRLLNSVLYMLVVSESEAEEKRGLLDLSINQAYESAPRMIEIQSCAPITSGNVDGGDDK